MKLTWSIGTSRLNLRKLNLQDAEFIQALLNDPDCIRFIGDRNIHSVEDAQKYLQGGPMLMYQQHNLGLLLVTLRTTGEPMGICGLLQRDYLLYPDIGFGFLPAFRTSGYAQEAAQSVINYAQENNLAKRICAIVSPDNTRSISLLNKLGLSFNKIMDTSELDQPTAYFIN